MDRRTNFTVITVKRAAYQQGMDRRTNFTVITVRRVVDQQGREDKLYVITYRRVAYQQGRENKLYSDYIQERCLPAGTGGQTHITVITVQFACQQGEKGQFYSDYGQAVAYQYREEDQHHSD